MTDPDLDLAAIDEAASKATPGPWRRDKYGRIVHDPDETYDIPDDDVIVHGDGFQLGQNGANAAYIALMSPDVARALVARVLEAEAKVEELCCKEECEHGISISLFCEACEQEEFDRDIAVTQRKIEEKQALVARLAAAEAVVEAARRVAADILPGGQLAYALAAYDGKGEP